MSAPSYLIDGFFAAHIKNTSVRILLADTLGHLQKQSAFPDSGITSEQDESIRNHSSAQNPVQLVHSGVEALKVLYGCRVLGFTLFLFERNPVFSGTGDQSAVYPSHFEGGRAPRVRFGFGFFFDKAAPGLTARTAPQPLWRHMAARLAAITDFYFHTFAVQRATALRQRLIASTR